MKLDFIKLLPFFYINFTQICILSHGLPVSPCPKIFQYRFDGAEWFGLLLVRNPDFEQNLQLRITLSMRGKPTTNYLGEIELLTRGQYLNNGPVLYKVKFPKHNFPPKLVQISTNNHIVCLGTADHSVFLTQIQLEHTRKFTFIPGEMTSKLTSPTSTGSANVEEIKDLFTNYAFNTKHLSLATFVDKYPVHSLKDICGTVHEQIRFKLHKLQPHSELREHFLMEESSKFIDVLKKKNSDSEAAQMPLFMSDDGYDDEVIVDSLPFDDTSNSSSVYDLPSITRGTWPWLAAIYVNNLTALAFQCGGTLVSTRIVISSAHCFKFFKQTYLANEVLVFLGRHNLKNWNEEGSLAAPVDNIYIHPDYDKNLQSYDADIAVIVLKNEVRFNMFIRPACIWSGSRKFEYIVGEHGVVVTWNLDHSGFQINSHITSNSMSSIKACKEVTTSVPRIVDAPIVSSEECFKINEEYKSLSSNRTFCAGVIINSLNQTNSTQTKQSKKLKNYGLCIGDSGAGLMIFKNNRWFLRGTVSATLPTSIGNSSIGRRISLNACNFNQYIIYTDVAKFLDWIVAFVV